MKLISVIGASGFIGRMFVEIVAAKGDAEIRVLVHNKNNFAGMPNVVCVEGDLLKAETLYPLFEEECTVINLAYLSSLGGQENIKAIENLIEACSLKKVGKLVHCSTAVVVGNATDQPITEQTKCSPISVYQETKLQIERVLLEKMPTSTHVSILRPTAVFGPGGLNLIKLAKELMAGNKLLLYIKSCLYGRRSLNLVYVENVVAALRFLIDTNGTDRQIFIISDDDSPFNNYFDVQKALARKFGVGGNKLPIIPLPIGLLGCVLKLANKPQPNPLVKYSDRKLANLGFEKPIGFEEGIRLFANWFKSQES